MKFPSKVKAWAYYNSASSSGANERPEYEEGEGEEHGGAGTDDEDDEDEDDDNDEDDEEGDEKQAEGAEKVRGGFVPLLMGRPSRALARWENPIGTPVQANASALPGPTTTPKA